MRLPVMILGIVTCLLALTPSGYGQKDAEVESLINELNQLTRKQWEVSEKIKNRLKQINDQTAISYWTNLSYANDAAIRMSAIRFLGVLGQDARFTSSVFSTLKERARQDPNKNVRAGAISAIGEIVSGAEPELVKSAQVFLIAVLEHSDGFLSWQNNQVCWALKNIGTKNARLEVLEKAVSVLIAHGKKAIDPQPPIEALGTIARDVGQPLASPVVDFLVEVFQRPIDTSNPHTKQIHFRAATYLAHLSAHVNPSLIPQIVDAVLEAISLEPRPNDPDFFIRASAAEALGSIYDVTDTPQRDPIITALTQALDDPSRYVQKGAATGLGTIGPDAASALPRLEQLKQGFHSDYPFGVEAVEKAIRRIQGSAEAP